MADEQIIAPENEPEEEKAKKDRYYWCRLKRDFFKSSDIQIIEACENGKEICYFYLKALCESIDFNGKLMITDNMCHTESTIAAITRTDIEIVKAAIPILQNFGLMEIQDGNIMFMTKLPELVGSESKYAKKKADQRKRQKGTNGGQCLANVSQMSPESGDNVSQIAGQCPTDIETEKESKLEKEKEIEINNNNNNVDVCSAQCVNEKKDYCMQEYHVPTDSVTDFINEHLPQGFRLNARVVNKYIGLDFDPFVIYYYAYYSAENSDTNPMGYFITIMDEKVEDGLTSIADLANEYCITENDRRKMFDKNMRFINAMIEKANKKEGCA